MYRMYILCVAFFLICSPISFAAGYKCETNDSVSYQYAPCNPDQKQTSLWSDRVVVPNTPERDEAPNIKALREDHEATIKRLHNSANEDDMEIKRKEWAEMKKECQRNRELIYKYPDNEYIVHDAAIAVNKNCR